MVLLFSKLSTMSFPCIVCEQNVRPKQHALECDSCFQWQHRRRRNSVGDLSQKKKTQTMADKVIEALINPTVLNQIVPILSEQIAESVAESINKALEIKINDHIKPLEKKSMIRIKQL